MYHSAIVDDNSLEHDILQLMLNQYRELRNIEITADHYMSGEELLTALGEGKKYDICFLDYIMPKLKGVDLADRMRETGYDGLIIFVSVTDEYVMDSFRVKPFYCIMKPVDPVKFVEILDLAAAELKSRKIRTIRVKTENGEKQFRLNDVLSISRINRSVQYKLSDGTVVNTPKLRTSFSDAVSDIVSEKGFLMTGTLVINMNQVAEVTREYIAFNDGSHFVPPKAHMKTIKEAIKEFWNNHKE